MWMKERERGTRCRREEQQWHGAVGPINARVCGVLTPSSEIVVTTKISIYLCVFEVIT